MLTFGRTLFVMSLPVGDTVLVVEAEEADLEAEAEADLRFPLLLVTVAVAAGGDISPPS